MPYLMLVLLITCLVAIGAIYRSICQTAHRPVEQVRND